MSTGKANDALGREQSDVLSTHPYRPAEAKRACCMCKHDNVRCNGKRPCSVCIAKGISGERCIDGCSACRQASLICDGHIPCSNCVATNQGCVVLMDVSAHDPTEPIASIGKSTPSLRTGIAERTKTACLACRRDNKRCEVNRPCSRCLRRNEECVSVERRQNKVKKRCQACRMEKGYCEDRRPCARCTEKGIECVDSARKGGPGSRIRKACTHCRRTKTQCDNERPCRNCVRRGLGCDDPLVNQEEPTGSPGPSVRRQRYSQQTTMPPSDSTLSLVANARRLSQVQGFTDMPASTARLQDQTVLDGSRSSTLLGAGPTEIPIDPSLINDGIIMNGIGAKDENLGYAASITRARSAYDGESREGSLALSSSYGDPQSQYSYHSDYQESLTDEKGL